MNLDEFHYKKYHAVEYNCSHFARDLWLKLTGSDIGDLVGAFNSGCLDSAMPARRGLQKLEQPQDPCLVWLAKPNVPPHIGVFVERRVFHMTPDGPRADPLHYLASLYNHYKFYTCLD